MISVTTKITSIRVEKGLDTGGIYIKEPIDISSGNADEILKKVSKIIFETMIPHFIHDNLRPVEQSGEVVVFSRRLPEQSEIPDGLSERQIYDYIRMLDGEGYPTAFIRNGRGKVLFSDARFEDGHVTAKARFVEDCRDE